ncbi:MAG TPA: hypothetical protein VL974_07215 [Magnetospirillum sp.]|jgi:hypothetical protein|nr:hypothetical protein [Magnetospirillum sp.]
MSTRIARAGHHVDCGEWASGLAILSGLRDCGRHGGCTQGPSCAAVAELLMGDLRGLLSEQNGTALPRS